MLAAATSTVCQTLLADKRINKRDVTVFLALLTYANSQNACFPSISTIAKMLGVTRQAIQHAIRKLADLKYITKVSRYEKTNDGKARQTSNFYTINTNVFVEEEFLRDYENKNKRKYAEDKDIIIVNPGKKKNHGAFVQIKDWIGDMQAEDQPLEAPEDQPLEYLEEDQPLEYLEYLEEATEAEKEVAQALSDNNVKFSYHDKFIIKDISKQFSIEALIEAIEKAYRQRAIARSTQCVTVSYVHAILRNSAASTASSEKAKAQPQASRKAGRQYWRRNSSSSDRVKFDPIAYITQRYMARGATVI